MFQVILNRRFRQPSHPAPAGFGIGGESLLSLRNADRIVEPFLDRSVEHVQVQRHPLRAGRRAEQLYRPIPYARPHHRPLEFRGPNEPVFEPVCVDGWGSGEF